MACCNLTLHLINHESFFDSTLNGYHFLVSKRLEPECSACNYRVFELGIVDQGNFFVISYLGSNKDTDNVFVNASTLLSIFPDLETVPREAAFALRAHREADYDLFHSGAVLLHPMTQQDIAPPPLFLSGEYEIGFSSDFRDGDIYIRIKGDASYNGVEAYFIALLKNKDYSFSVFSEPIKLHFDKNGYHYEHLPSLSRDYAYDQWENLYFVYRRPQQIEDARQPLENLPSTPSQDSAYLETQSEIQFHRFVELKPSFNVRLNSCCTQIAFTHDHIYDSLNRIYEIRVQAKDYSIRDIPSLQASFHTSQEKEHKGLSLEKEISIYVDAKEYGSEIIAGSLNISYFSPIEGYFRSQNIQLLLQDHLIYLPRPEVALKAKKIIEYKKQNIAIEVEWEGNNYGIYQITLFEKGNIVHSHSIAHGNTSISFPFTKPSDKNEVLTFSYLLSYLDNNQLYYFVGELKFSLDAYYQKLKNHIHESLHYHNNWLSYTPNPFLEGHILHVEDGNAQYNFLLTEKSFFTPLKAHYGLTAYIGSSKYRITL